MPALTLTGELRRAEILDAAAELFEESGFHGTSTAAIAARVGTAKATVYHYFRAKHDILFAIHDDWIEHLIATFRRREAENDDPLELLHAVFRDLLALIDAKPGHVRVFFECFRELPPDLLADARTKRDLYERLVEETLLRGMRDGAVTWQDPRTAAFGLFGMCNWAYQWYRPGGRLHHAQIADQLFAIFRDGAARRPDAAEEA